MSNFDNSLYVRNDSQSRILIILYVDDLVIGGESLVDINKVKFLLFGKFEMTNMKELHYFLGIEVIRGPLFRPIQQLSAEKGNSERIQLQIHTGT